MHEEKQIVGRVLDSLVNPRDLGSKLARKSCPGGNATIHADALFVCTVPLSPPIALGCLNGDTVMVTDDVRQCLQPERPRVVFVCSPRSQLDVRNCFEHPGVATESEPRPLIHDLAGTEIRIPCQTTEPIEIRRS